ncbi:MAG: DUF5916 domain-containing protein [Bacteroidia bacterium]|nr:DUF5916 domain-containing protein [Bacteroidia bacterium]
MKSCFTFICFAGLLHIAGLAQLLHPEPYTNQTRQKAYLHVAHTATPVKADGVLDEPVWAAAEKTRDFLNKWPVDSGYAAWQTQVQVSADDDFLYLAIICRDSGDYIIQSLKRDQMEEFWNSDAVSVVIDPVNRQTNGFFFGLNALGAQSEGLIGTGDDNFSFDWDNKWFSGVRNYDDHWVAEMAIPFNTLRFDAGSTEWGINFIRNNIKQNLYSVWSWVPVNFEGVDLGYTGRLVWDQAPAPPKGNISLIPYVRGGLAYDAENGKPPAFSRGVGLDAKVAITSSLNLDLTVNPDFSQVEVDRQVTNLQRFDLFFPERRTFFLENSDLFNAFGIPPTRPFFSRRIGLQDGQAVPILLGARLSGNLTEPMRIGLMSIQTAAYNQRPSQNYTVGAVQYRVLKRSSVSGIVLNRQGFDGIQPVKGDFARNAGLEFGYSSLDGKWTTWSAVHTSLSDEQHNDRNFLCFGGMYQGRAFSHVTSYSYTGTHFDAEMGFNSRQENYDFLRDTVVKLGYQIIFQEFGYNIYPKVQRKIARHGFSLTSVPFLNPDNSLNEWSIGGNYEINFNNQSNIEFSGGYNHINLPFATDLIGSGSPLLPDTYRFANAAIGFNTDTRKRLLWAIEGSYGGFYTGTLLSLESSLTYRAQPWGNFSIQFAQNNLDLGPAYGKANLLLISPRIDIVFTRSVFWTTFLQYNTQQANFNINSRFQWRFKPMSDLFVVYTDNYDTGTFAGKNRALVVKLNYWFTI